MKTYKGETGQLYKTLFAWYGTVASFTKDKKSLIRNPKDIFCAWCHKSQAEIKKTEDLNEHIENHAKEDKK